ncbi:DUF485 domain-containing protein [Brevibacterium luteolum]|uniref:DUF485 domain-containing protein n=1 Tax=Brevibacterium luteolum TaxID=199591 RepID=UPI001FB5EA2C|nr:DUF485 domain-containing protein [Brevibacterium luteolum]
MSPPTAAIDFEKVESQPEFQALKKKHRSLVLPLSAFFFIWYFAYVLLGAYAHDFMATPVFGNINLGILLGLGQFVTTFIITMVYVRFANRRIDPAANEIRLMLEKQAADFAERPADTGGTHAAGESAETRTEDMEGDR